ncbi:MAG: hypothetical protein OXH52_20545 [Gammaproteobacteria bacterium]|nr:hypothetical protein [Gammaproteobacteria bacterium]
MKTLRPRLAIALVTAFCIAGLATGLAQDAAWAEAAQPDYITRAEVREIMQGLGELQRETLSGLGSQIVSLGEAVKGVNTRLRDAVAASSEMDELHMDLIQNLRARVAKLEAAAAAQEEAADQ